MQANIDLNHTTPDPSVWLYRLRQLIAEWDITPGHITGIYLVFGFLGLYFSDVLLVRLVEDPTRLSQLQALKGGVEVVLTGGLIFALVRRSRRALRRTNDRLEHQQAELQVLHRVLRHNLRNDMTVIIGYATNLLEEVDDDRHRTWCHELVRGAERIVHYADQARKINKVTADGVSSPLDLVETVEAVLEDHPALGEAESVEVSLPDAAPVRAHPMLETAIDELLTNAVRHHDRDDPHVVIEVDHAQGPAHRTELVVRDDGPGIPAHVREAIQQRGESQLLHLDGLGLWLVSWVVTVSDGSLAIDDRSPRGSNVRLQLPRATTATRTWTVPTGT